jgi:hypothetical protein
MLAEEPALHVSENFSTPEWAAELYRVDPTYVTPTIGTTKAVINTVPYFDKYYLDGAIVPLEVNADNPTLECALFASKSIVHTNGDGHAISFRLRNSGVSIMEFPEIPNAGLITVHARNGNKTDSTTLKLQKYEMDAWTDLHVFDLQPSNSFRETSLDEIVSFNIQSEVPIKLRLSRGNKFIMLFQVDIAAYAPTSVKNPVYAGFRLSGRTLSTDEPTQVSLYNILGKVVHEVYVENSVELPASIGDGLYIVKGNQGIQKIQLR